MPDSILLYGAPDADPDLFHAVPVGIVDPFLYAEVDGRRAALTWVAEADKFRALGIEVLDRDALGAAGLARAGLPEVAIDAELALRACQELGVTAAAVP